MPLNADKALETYVKLRDYRSKLKAAYEAEDEKAKDNMTKIETALLAEMQNLDLQQLGSAHGTAYKQIVYKGNCSDWPSFWAFCAAENRFDMLEKRLSIKAIQTYVEETESSPPGVNLLPELKIVIRRK